MLDKGNPHTILLIVLIFFSEEYMKQRLRLQI